MNRTFFGQKGFTLIELLVSIAILAILASLITPVVSQAIGRVREARCFSNLRQIGVGATLYIDDHNGLMPPKDPVSWVINGATVSYPKFSDFIAPYIQKKDGKRTIWYCPGDARNVDMSYGLNVNLLPDGYTNGVPFPVKHVIRTTEVLMMADSGWNKYSVREVFYGDEYPLKNRNVEFRHPKGRKDQANPPTSVSDFPTEARSSMLFMDGHVEMMAPAQLANRHYYPNI
jgi:prepilin-type N-terminal cleavage/methylation domain-containing protein/prepilin-type processing-associated H-X9-DG protein